MSDTTADDCFVIRVVDPSEALVGFSASVPWFEDVVLLVVCRNTVYAEDPLVLGT